ncbi:MAG: hypothetical protein HRU01_28920, partial [Myxococcales bacterium]|nr:hypothetical protein [Myxococcales bacterium]
MSGFRAMGVFLAALAGTVFAADAKAGEATRIQLVAEIPNLALSVVDDSGEISGPIDGIATDALLGPAPGNLIEGAVLNLSVPASAAQATWGHIDGTGKFVAGLPAADVDGSYQDPQPPSSTSRLYVPPIEFDLSGPNNASERSIELAVQLAWSSEQTTVHSKQILLVKPPVVLV